MSLPSILNKLISENDSLVYIAGRLFDIEEKIKSEFLDRAVLNGINAAFKKYGIFPTKKKFTYVPFRDAGQEQLNILNKSKLLYNLDISKLNSSVMIVAYIDGLSKDEGVCFELGYALAKNVPILLISTDFFSHLLPNGVQTPFDPLVWHTATERIRVSTLSVEGTTFEENLINTRKQVLDLVTSKVEKILCNDHKNNIFANRAKPQNIHGVNIYADFGGEIFEWQKIFAEKLSEIIAVKDNFKLSRPIRYKSTRDLGSIKSNSHTIENLIEYDLRNIIQSEIVIICSDGDECHSGAAFTQGFSRAMDKQVWLYNSKDIKIIAHGGYSSSRNLMLDNSADSTYCQFSDIINSITQLT